VARHCKSHSRHSKSFPIEPFFRNSHFFPNDSLFQKSPLFRKKWHILEQNKISKYQRYTNLSNRNENKPMQTQRSITFSKKKRVNLGRDSEDVWKSGN
jgi:hypothetical protein